LGFRLFRALLRTEICSKVRFGGLSKKAFAMAVVAFLDSFLGAFLRIPCSLRFLDLLLELSV
jgi:hypothetical protein